MQDVAREQAQVVSRVDDEVAQRCSRRSAADLRVQQGQLPHVEEPLEQALQDADPLRCGQVEVRVHRGFVPPNRPPRTPAGPVHSDILQHPPTHTTSRSTSSLDYLGALVEQLPGALLPTRLPSDALCLCAFSLSFPLADGWATVTPGAEGVPAPSQFGASLTGRVTVAIMGQGLAHTHRALQPD